MWWILAFIIIGFLAITALPLAWVLARAVWKIHGKHTASQKVDWVETKAQNLTEEMQESMGRLVQQFVAEGFQTLANIQNRGAVSGAEGTQIFMLNPETKETAQIIITRAMASRSVVFWTVTRFQDDKRVITSARRTAGFMPRDPAVDTISFSWVRDVQVLHEAHRRRIELLGKTRLPKKCPGASDWRTWLDKAWDEELQRSVDLGYRYLDEETKVYRFTWKGAALVMFKLLPPIRHFRMRREQARARLVWNSLKMDDFCASQKALVEHAETLPASGAAGFAIPIGNEASIEYATGSKAGLVRRERVGESLVVTVREPALKLKLLRTIIAVTIILAMTAVLTRAAWDFVYLRTTLPAAYSPLSRIIPILIFSLMGMIWPIGDLVRLYSARRGEVRLIASRAGLRAINVPGLSEDLIPREDLQGLLAIKSSLFGKKEGFLIIRFFDGTKRKKLIRRAALATLISVRKELSEAMGMELPLNPPPLPNVEGQQFRTM